MKGVADRGHGVRQQLMGYVIRQAPGPMKSVQPSVEMTRRNSRQRIERTARQAMSRTVEAVIDEQGNVRLLEPVRLPSAGRALLTILDDRRLRTRVRVRC